MRASNPHIMPTFLHNPYFSGQKADKPEHVLRKPNTFLPIILLLLLVLNGCTKIFIKKPPLPYRIAHLDNRSSPPGIAEKTRPFIPRLRPFHTCPRKTDPGADTEHVPGFGCRTRFIAAGKG